MKRWGWTLLGLGWAMGCSASAGYEEDYEGDYEGSDDGASMDASYGPLYGAGGNSSSSAGTGGASAGEQDEEDDGVVGGAAGSAPFEPPATNPFVMVEHDPLSTFAADVDTASYDLFRSFVDAGSLPPPASVRLEEFVNSFSYEYAPPDPAGTTPFAIHLDAAPNLVDRETTVLRVGIQGKVVPPTEKRPANLVFLVDVSGSMSYELPLVQAVLEDTTDLLDPEDTIAIVTYAGSVGTLLPATPVSQKDLILEKIDQLVSGGSTNGAGGIQAAYAEAQGAFIEGGINHVLLCTDGDFNVGISSTDALEELIVEKRKTGVTLTVLGFGAGGRGNDAMMERISNAGNGIYGYIGSQEDATEYVAERMLQTLIHIAQDVKIQVEFNPEHVVAYRLLGYENRAIADEDFRDDVIDAGEIGSGHTVTALYELVFDEAALPSAETAPPLDAGRAHSGAVEIDPEDLVLVKVRYKEPGASETDPASEVAATLAPSDVRDALGNSASDLQWAIAVATFAELLKQSPYAARSALPALELIVQAQAGRDQDRGEFALLLGAAKSRLPAN